MEPGTKKSEDTALYTEQDFMDIKRQLRRRAAALAGLSALLLAAVIASFALRRYWLTVALTALLSMLIVFVYDLLIRPVAAYQRHLDQVLHGRVRTATGIVKRVEEKTVMRDGVRFYPVLLNVGPKSEETDDRLFYFDANLPLPAWQIGESITVTAHDKAIGAWNRA